MCSSVLFRMAPAALYGVKLAVELRQVKTEMAMGFHCVL